MATNIPTGRAASDLALIQTLQAHMSESRLTRSRPLSSGEVAYAFSRRAGGTADPSTIVSLTCSRGHAITDDRVILACAALRLRHPLFASHVTFIDGTPHFVVNAPVTRAHALRTSAGQIEFHTFTDQDDAVAKLRDEWLAVSLDKALDIRERTCTVWWGRDTDTRSGKYVLGVLTTHFVTDQRRSINLVRHFVELLASPGKAQSELDAHLSGAVPPALIPTPTQELVPRLNENEEETSKAKLIFNEIYTRFANKPMSGIVPNGSLSTSHFVPRFLRKVWPEEETIHILQACKARGVTVTHLMNIASALSALKDNHQGAEANGNSDSDTIYLDFSQPIDLATKFPKHLHEWASGEMETAVRIGMFPILLDVPRSAVADAVHAPSTHIWALVERFKERNNAFIESPYFWRFMTMYDPLFVEAHKARVAGRPALPFISSLGDLKSLLPALYTVQETELEGTPTNDHSAEGTVIRITDMLVAGRLDNFSLSCHLFTFDGKLHLQLRYNAERASPALMGSWFDYLVDVVTQVTHASDV